MAQPLFRLEDIINQSKEWIDQLLLLNRQFLDAAYQTNPITNTNMDYLLATRLLYQKGLINPLDRRYVEHALFATLYMFSVDQLAETMRLNNLRPFGKMSPLDMIRSIIDGRVPEIEAIGPNLLDVLATTGGLSRADMQNLALGMGSSAIAQGMQPQFNRVQAWIRQGLNSIIRSGDLTGARYLIENEQLTPNEESLSNAVRSGNVQLVQYLEPIGIPLGLPLRLSMFEDAVSSIQLIQYFEERFPIEQLIDHLKIALRNSLSRQYYDSFFYLIEQSPLYEFIDGRLFDLSFYEILRMVAAYGNVNVLRFLIERSRQSQQFEGALLENPVGILSTALENFKLDIAHYILDRYPNIDYYFLGQKEFNLAAIAGDIELLRKLKLIAQRGAETNRPRSGILDAIVHRSRQFNEKVSAQVRANDINLLRYLIEEENVGPANERELQELKRAVRQRDDPEIRAYLRERGYEV